MDHATLPSNIREELTQRFDQSAAFVINEQSQALQASPLQVLQEIPPALPMLLEPFRDAQNLAVTIRTHPDRDQHRNVLEFPAPRTLQPGPVQVNLDVFPFERPVPTSFDLDCRSAGSIHSPCWR
jgi:hypothetical protein